MASHYLSETDVLFECDPSLTDSDDWPEFRLSDVNVTLPQARDEESIGLLVASEHHPVTVTGRLQPPTVGQEQFWRRQDGGKKGTPIVLKDVRIFAYGGYEDGSVEIWASGKAGWFVIQPSRAYKSIYQDMCAAVKMLFFVADAYTEPEPSKKSRNAQSWSEPNTEQVFEKYAREILGDEARVEEAAEAIYEHRDFLLSSMLAGKEGKAWGRNPLFRHLSRKFADDLKAIRERTAAPQEKPGSKLMKNARQGSVESGSTSSSLKRKRGRPPKNKAVDAISIGSSSAASSATKDLPRRPAPARSEQQKPKEAAKPAPTRRTRNNSQSIPRSATLEVQQSATPAQDSDSDDVPAHSAGKGKSALRLKPSKPMKGPPKGPPKSGKAPVQDDEPRSSPIPSKRRRDEPTDVRRPKRRNSKQEVDEGIDIPTSPSSHSTPADDDPDAAPGAADEDETSHPPLSEALSAHKPDPLQESTWLCALDGCTHKIYGDPSDPVSQRLIRGHYALHAYDDDARVQLVKRLQAPSMPVNHLMERVKVAAKGEGFPGSKVAGTRFPEPLRTRF